MGGKLPRTLYRPQFNDYLIVFYISTLSIFNGGVLMRTSIISSFLLLAYSIAAMSHPGINDIPSAPHGASFVTPFVGGMPVFCTAFNNQPVALVSDHLLNDVGAARNINGQLVIFMNPHVLLSLPNENQLFWYAHECAHVNIRTVNEDLADCAAVKLGRQQGWLTAQGIQSLCTYFQGNPGDWTHSPGPVRCQKMAACYYAP